MRNLVLSLLILASPAWAQADEPVVLVLGDSLSAAYGMPSDQGWVALLGERLAAASWPGRVVNASISGETTSGGLARLPALLDEFHPAFVIIELGANDGLRGLSMQQMRGNLQSLIAASRGAGAEVLLLGVRLPPNYGERYNTLFEQVYRELADELSVPLLPFFLEPVALDERYMMADGLHPNSAGQPIILDHVWPTIETWLTVPAATALENTGT